MMNLNEKSHTKVKPLKILYHHRTQGRGAEGVHITSIVQALEQMGHYVKVLSPPGVNPLSSAGNAPVDKSEVKTSGISTLWKMISTHLPNFIFELLEIVYNIPSSIRLEKELSTTSYDLIYERYAFYMISGAWKAQKYAIPLVLEANEVSGIHDRARTQTFVRLCSKFEKFLFSRCASIHTVSSYLKEMIVKQKVNPAIITITPNAIDPRKFNGKKDFGHLKRQYGIEENKLIIGFAGWFDEWDRLDLLIDIFHDLSQSEDNLLLLLIGDGSIVKTLKNKVKHLGMEEKVIFTGAVSRDTVNQYISLLDIAVFTHSNEFGSPVVMFEFMGLKIPIVAPNLLPITDVLTHNKNSVLFETMDMTGLKQALIDLIRDRPKQREISEAAFNLLMTRHTWMNNAQQIVSIIQESGKQ